MDNQTKLDQINKIKSSRSRERDKLDNILLTIAAGTLSLSVTFLNQSPHTFIETKILFASWIFLIIGLASILFGYIFAELHFKNFEKDIKEDKLKTFDDGENNCWFKYAEITNWMSFIAIIIGIVLFAYFGYLNIS